MGGKRLGYSIVQVCIIFMFICCSDVKKEEKSVRDTPNVILIYADDLGRGLLSEEGQRIIKTPNIDKLAHEGIRFENAYGSMFCAPARASLLTGYHDAHGDKWQITSGGAFINISRGKLNQQEIETKINEQLDEVPESEVFLPEVFKDAGYVTGEIGKLEWGFSATNKQMERHGWDYYYGYLDHVRCHGFYPPFLFENGNLVNIEGNTLANCGKSVEKETQSAYDERWNMEGKAVYSQNIFLEKIVDFIRKNKEAPFFLYHPTQLPHGPVAIPEVHEEFKNDDRLTQIEKEYASMVKMLDDHVGVIMKELKDLGIDDNTMVLFTSDNGHEIYYSQEGRILKPVRNMKTGEFFDDVETKYYSELAGDVFDGNDGMAGIKRSNWEGGVRVPLIARWPGKIKPGTTSNALASNYDFMATMADLVGFKVPENKDGISYLPELIGEDVNKGREYVVYSSFVGPGITTHDGWKLRYFAKDDIYQLYYLPDDYKEENNIISSNQEIAEKLKKILLKECGGDLNNGWFRTRSNILSSING
ncbi:arylsulfatase [Kriegella aquimaris]|uniref:Arylsulfatase A n=1 Tax=Kriegella aquimaris TaxID=192904 RepID=A0A1G9KJK3_9FLAO|nr:arylsulfatase [Kriegella aquimaris]SDL49978.1 Arylsulfatase A [Kriegella aquimaris]